MEHIIDATNKSLGRVASAAAVLLMGKNNESFVRNRAPKVSVHITNASKANLTEKKRKEKKYMTYSGYPGGLKSKSLEELIIKKGSAEAFRKAVKGMLPKNKLAKVMMKNLKITE